MRNTRFDKTFGTNLPREVQVQRLRRVIQQELTELQRHTLTAYYFGDQTLEQIAEERNVAKSTVWRTLKRAENKIRRILKY